MENITMTNNMKIVAAVAAFRKAERKVRIQYMLNEGCGFFVLMGNGSDDEVPFEFIPISPSHVGAGMN